MPVLPAELSSIPPTGVLSGSTPVFAAAFSEPHHVLVQERASPLGFVPGFNASAILQGKQQRQLQFIATTFSSISILAAMCAIYWFCMMRRNFRRDLVLLLIFGDFWKSFWFLVFSTVTLSTGHIDTQEKFCQASGYFLQVGFEACGEINDGRHITVAFLLLTLHRRGHLLDELAHVSPDLPTQELIPWPRRSVPSALLCRGCLAHCSQYYGCIGIHKHRRPSIHVTRRILLPPSSTNLVQASSLMGTALHDLDLRHGGRHTHIPARWL
jgi:hypothetical protein